MDACSAQLFNMTVGNGAFDLANSKSFMLSTSNVPNQLITFVQIGIVLAHAYIPGVTARLKNTLTNASTLL